ncbi:MAG: hypothetical protein ACLGIR_12520 [Actinomycetes bacterium]
MFSSTTATGQHPTVTMLFSPTDVDATVTLGRQEQIPIARVPGVEAVPGCTPRWRIGDRGPCGRWVRGTIFFAVDHPDSAVASLDTVGTHGLILHSASLRDGRLVADISVAPPGGAETGVLTIVGWQPPDVVSVELPQPVELRIEPVGSS